MATKTGYSTLCIQSQPFERIEAYLSRYPNSVCEILNDGLHHLNTGRVQTLKRIRPSYGLEYAMHLPFILINYAATNPSLRRAVQRIILTALDHAAELECTHAIIHSGQNDGLSSFSPELARRHFLEFLEKVGRTAVDHGVQMCIENNASTSYIIHTASEMARFFEEEASQHFRIALDIGHASIHQELDEYIRRFQGKINHVHLHDNLGKQDEHLPLDQGNIDWRRAVGQLLNNGFEGFLVIENQSWEDNEKSLALLRDFLAKF